MFILLSHSENFGLSIAEALSYQLPVITTTNTPWKKLEKYKCGWCINLNEIIARTLEKAIELPCLEKKINGSKGAKKLDDKKDFSDQSIGLRKMFIKFYKNNSLKKK